MPEVEKQTGANNVIIVGAIVGKFYFYYMFRNEIQIFDKHNIFEKN